MKSRFYFFLTALIPFLTLFSIEAAEKIRVGSKTFTESYILAQSFQEAINRLDLENIEAELRLGMGGTGVVFSALQTGEIDLYPEYTGTITEAILKDPSIQSFSEIQSRLLKEGLVISKPLGFNNTYAFAVKKSFADKHHLNTISDLVSRPDIVAGFTYEFMKRSDGLPALLKHYKIEMPKARGMEHALSYQALADGSVELIDVYATDAKIQSMNLKILRDDQDFFPRYDAVILARKVFTEKYPNLWKELRKNFEGKIDNSRMIGLNALVDLKGLSFKQAAYAYFDEFLVETAPSFISPEFWRRLKEHVFLVLFSLLASVLVGIPLGLLAVRSKFFEQLVLGFSGIVQTIPSLALLCFMIPLLGIGVVPAIVALFLYGLLPIVRSTFTGVQSLDPKLDEISYVIGLSSAQKIKWIELPLASRHILSGVKTSAVIGVGTATLAAFIGAGGLGSFIVTGLALNDIPMILQGAIPSALLAIIMQGAFDFSDRLFVPKGLRL